MVLVHFLYVLLFTCQSVTLLPLDYSTFLCDITLVLRASWGVSDGIASLKIETDSYFTTDGFDTFTETLCVGYHHSIFSGCFVTLDLCSVVLVVVFHFEPNKSLIRSLHLCKRQIKITLLDQNIHV